jgi:CubicO group peptidase (beta-lactamase class C family)
MLQELQPRLRQRATESNFSGVISARIGGHSFCDAFGYRDGPNQVFNTVETRFHASCVTKAFTAVGIATLVESGDLRFDMPVRSVVGAVVRNLHPRITLHHLLCHTSGIGDFLDDLEIDDIEQIALDIPVQRLQSPQDYIPSLEDKRQKFDPGTRFCYSNGGYIVLAIIIEHLTGQPFQDFIDHHVFGKAKMARSGFFRTDSLPENTAIGYLRTGDCWQSNLFNLPVRGSGDGGAFTTLDDMDRFWRALLQCQLIRRDLVAEILNPQARTTDSQIWAGYGVWLDKRNGQIALIGSHAGASMKSCIRRSEGVRYTIISNSTSGAWPMADLVENLIKEANRQCA